jgi:DNA polymerase I-like protein with 3'-5' exonuclease and polymerase domains
MDLGAVKLHAQLPSVDPTARIFALVHDAAYVECAKDKAPEVARLVESCLSCEIQLAGADSGWMPLPAAAQIADNWKDAA